jgi:hypothetical protein
MWRFFRKMGLTNDRTPDSGRPDVEADAAAPRRPVNLRSVSIGLVGVMFICLLAPYNDFVLRNTFLVGSHLPASLLIFFLLIVLLINAPLRRWLPRYALGGHELAVALGMALVGSALPSVGLMRYLPGHLVAPFAHAAETFTHAELLRELDLPDWMWPSFASADPVERGNEPVVTDFYGRAYLESPTFRNQVAAVPWSRWIMPAVAWGIFFAALFGAAVCMSAIFRRQWVDNERLAFPLATVYLSLIEPPEKGRTLNRLLRSPVFWIACAAVFAMHGMNALSLYFPRNVPMIPLQYDLSGIFTEEPWLYTQWSFKRSTVFFTIIGIMFFVQARVAFSLWFFYLLMEVARMVMGMRKVDVNWGGVEQDQMFGALLVLGVMILWISRQHLSAVAGQMFRRPREGEPRGRYLPYAAAGWGLLGCLGIMAGWLVIAGASLSGAVVIVGLILLVYLVLTRIVAETGLLYVLLPVQLNRAWIYAGDLSGGSIGTTLRSYFFGQYFFGMLLHDTREASPVFVTHAMRVADEEAYAGVSDWRRALPFVLMVMLALMLAFAVGGASTLFIHYNYAATLDQTQETPIGEWGSYRMPRQIGLEGTQQFVPPRTGPIEPHNRVGHMVSGAGITGFLSVMNLRFAAWPLHPVGFLLANTWGIRQIWFSILLGWLAKSLIIRYGGAGLFGACRPFFLGLIFGEAAAIAFWLSASIILNAMGYEYRAVFMLPSV